MNSAHPLYPQRTKMDALENFYATLAAGLGFVGSAAERDRFISEPSFPKHYYISDVGFELIDPSLYFRAPKHGIVFHALGRNGWEREKSTRQDTFHFVKMVFGVRVELTDAQRNLPDQTYRVEVDPDFFGEATIPAHSVEEVSR